MREEENVKTPQAILGGWGNPLQAKRLVFK